MINQNHFDDSNSFCEDEPNFDILLRLSKITQGPLLERRKEIRKSFVLAALSMFSIGSSFKVQDLYSRVKKMTKCEIDDENIISILNELQRENVVRHISRFDYKLIEKIVIPDFQHNSQLVWDDFSIFLRTQYKDFDPFIDKDARNVFDCVLIEILKQFIISAEPLERQVESLPIEDFESLIKKEVNRANLSNNLTKIYSKIINTYIHSDSKVFLQFIFDNYSNQINIDLITREQEMPSLNFLDDVYFLLVDTPFLTALMCKTDSVHPLASAVAKQCENSKIPLYYTTKTKYEMFSFINGSKYELSGLSTRKKGIVKSQFIKDFQHQNIPLSEYLIILESWEKIIESHYNIKLIPDDSNVKIDDNYYHYIYKAISLLDIHRNQDRVDHIVDYQPRYRKETQLDHDAFCISLIAKFRDIESSEGKKTIGPWFLTFDSILALLNETNFKQNDKYGYVIQPRILLNWLLIYSKIQFKEEDKKLVAEAIIRFTIRNKEEKITLVDYTRLITYKLGLDEKDIEVMVEILLASPLRAELEKALDLDYAEEADMIASKIVSNPEFVESIIKERETSEKFNRVVKTLHEKNEELTKEKSARKALEQAHNNISVTANINTTIDINITNEVNTLIHFLDGENAFKDGQLEKPSDFSTNDDLIKWLEGIREVIETSKTIGNGIKSLSPFILHILMKFQGT